MKQILATILQTVLTTIIAAITQRWDREQAESDRAAAEAKEWQLQQIRKHTAEQAAMHQRVLNAPVPQSGAAWNAGACVLCLVLLTGCFRHYVPVQPLLPVPPQPERPQLADESPFSPREQTLAAYAAQVEAALAEARAFAISHNQANGYAVTPADAAWLEAHRSR